MLMASRDSGFDLDGNVEKIEIDHLAPVYDASGNRMKFKGAVRLAIELEDGVKQKIALFVIARADGMIVLGTNTLAKLGFSVANTRGGVKDEETETDDSAGLQRPPESEISLQLRSIRSNGAYSDTWFHPLARAKTVNDIFELANIASISEQESMDAHRRRCPLYAKREEARGMKYDHPTIYPWPCEYPIGDILAGAIMMLGQIEMPLLNHHMDHHTFIALPPSFVRLDSEMATRITLSYMFIETSELLPTSC
ncbi:unnamed protein product [Cylicocyclus nassatus]|uniref:Uncharacterized protein n=1 Tax=Cylicocyclus nassatus TaxID=53992 RepID=A0AA36HAP2_CYLNA|nr:unnamed protein product [Cylicocyclus nassatus]CAJ0607112.1 unnamed protein product [Cylicocyclus nassatus]